MDASKLQADVYDEEFFNNLQLAKNLVSKIKRNKDKTICRKWIVKLCHLKSDDVVVKKNRNAFFKYMLQILHKAAQADAKQGDDDEEEVKKEKPRFQSKWSADKRTYVAVQPLPGQGALVYMAVSSDPKLGWEHPND